MVQIAEQVKDTSAEPYRRVCRELDMAYSSLMRWKRRRKAGTPLVRHPGPAKVEPLHAGALYEEIRQLRHGRRRTQGTGRLYDRYRRQISRRAFHELVEATRRELRQEEKALERRVEWLIPGMVWSMDDTEGSWLDEGRLGHIHLVRDLGSRYNLRVLGDEVLANGLAVALDLERLFIRHGPPLFLKLDGGSNFHHQEVLDLLDEKWVIPLLSPPYYPPYNGAIERGHQEVLRQMWGRIGNETRTARELRLECEISGHEVNHKRRRSLGDQTACHALETSRPGMRWFGRRERKEVFEQIKALTLDIAHRLGEYSGAVHETAFRYAAETWLQSHQFIRVSRNGEVLPCFYQIQSH